MFTFIIPCYNEALDIGNTINSVINQTYDKEYEVIVINDGSRDDSENILNKLERENERVKIISYSKNRGVSYARNVGIDNANGDILIFLNADEQPEKDFLQKLEKKYLAGADYLFPESCVKNNEKGYGMYRDIYRKYFYTEQKKVMWSQGFSCKKDIILEVGKFDERYPGCGGEDWDIVRKIDKLGKCRVVDNNIVVWHVVPCKMNEIIWHMFNRGRGTAFNEIIYAKKSPVCVCMHEMLELLIILAILLMSRKFLVLYGIWGLLKYCGMVNSMLMKTGAKEKKYTIYIFFALDILIRKIGYIFTMLKEIANGKR